MYLLKCIRIIRAFGLYDGLRFICWKILYKMNVNFFQGGEYKRVRIRRINRHIYIRPYSTDILLLMDFFILDCDGKGGREYEIDFGDRLGHINYILDAGANIGLFTMLYAFKYPDAKIIAVEPEEENFKLLVKNTAGLENVICLKAGIWDKDMYLEIIPRETGEWGFVVHECKYPKENGIKGTTVFSIMKKYGFPYLDILKMDIEGSELEVFSSNDREWLKRVNALIIETHERIKPGCEKLVSDVMGLSGFYSEKNGENTVYLRKARKNELDLENSPE